MKTEQSDIKVAGASGCRVEVVVYNHRPVVRKSTTSTDYAQRLRKQMEKQASFNLTIGGIQIPKIIDYDNMSFTMEYLHMLNCVDFFEIATPQDIRARVEIVIQFIKVQLRAAIPTAVKDDLFLTKLNTIQRAVSPQVWQEYYSDHADKIRTTMPVTMVVPLGKCHGDLTFSNIMFSNDEIAIGLIDFLDSFLESPIVDIVKLRQDTKFNWTSRRYNETHDITKIFIVMSWLDKIIEATFGDIISNSFFHIIEKMNYIRIAPYVQSYADHSFLSNVLKKLEIS